MKYYGIGLVLEGGGVRGIYTAGVLDAFMEWGLEFGGVIGVSAGAIHGCSYVSKQKGRSIRYYMKYCKDPRFMSFRSWIKTGDIVGADFCYRELPEELDVYDYDAFNGNDTEFYVTCSNVETAEAEYLKITDMKEEIDLLRASASLPYFSRLVEWKGKKYLDGGCTDSIPVDAFEKMGYANNVVILTRDPAYTKKPELSWLPGLVYRKYKGFCEVLRNRHMGYNQCVEEINEKKEQGTVFVIQPEQPLEIGRLETNPEKVKEIYDLGYKDAEKQKEKLLDWLENIYNNSEK